MQNFTPNFEVLPRLRTLDFARFLRKMPKSIKNAKKYQKCQNNY